MGYDSNGTKDNNPSQVGNKSMSNDKMTNGVRRTYSEVLQNKKVDYPKDERLDRSFFGNNPIVNAN